MIDFALEEIKKEFDKLEKANAVMIEASLEIMQYINSTNPNLQYLNPTIPNLFNEDSREDYFRLKAYAKDMTRTILNTESEITLCTQVLKEF